MWIFILVRTFSAHIDIFHVFSGLRWVVKTMLKVNSFWSVNDKEVLTNVCGLIAQSFRKQALPAVFSPPEIRQQMPEHNVYTCNSFGAFPLGLLCCRDPNICASLWVGVSNMNIPNFLTFEISGQLNDRKEIIIGVDIFARKKMRPFPIATK